MANRVGRTCAVLGAAGTLAIACLRTPAATQTDFAPGLAHDAGALPTDTPDAEVQSTDAADAGPTTDPLELLAPTGPILRERVNVVVDGVVESWRLEWREPPTFTCSKMEEGAMSCACWGFTVAETGQLDLVRSRPSMPDERLALSPLFSDDGEHAIVKRWELARYEHVPEDFASFSMFRPAATVIKLGDYDHDGRSTEFVLQVAAVACYESAVVVGISKSNPHLHVFTSVESPKTPVTLYRRAQWERLRTSSTIDVVQMACGERALGWGEAPDGGVRCDLPDNALRIRADGEFHVTDTSRSCRGRMPGVDENCQPVSKKK